MNSFNSRRVIHAPHYPTNRRRRTGDSRFVVFLVSTAILAVGLGNLAIPLAVHAAMPVDYLVVTLAVLGGYLIFHLPNVIRYGSRVLVLTLFIVALIPGIIQASSNPYSQAKLQAIVIAAILLSVPLSLAAKKESVFRLTVGMGACVCVFFSCLLLAFGQTSDNGRLSVFDLNPIGIGRLTATGATIWFVLLITRWDARRYLKWLVAAMLLLCLFSTITTGSRGPLLAWVIACVLVIVAMIAKGTAHYWWIVVIAAVALTGVQLLFGDNESGIDRVFSGVDSGRTSIYSDTIKVILAHPVGIGWGNLASYMPQYPTEDGYTFYPHNLLLEMGAEGGFLALAACVILLVVAFAQALRYVSRSSSVLAPLLLGLLAFNVINAQVSSDIVGNRFMWVALGFAIALPPRPAGEGKRYG